MSKRSIGFCAPALLCFIGLLSGPRSVLGAGPRGEADVKKAIELAIKPLLEKHGIPGMAIGLTIDGKRYFVEYGQASRKPQSSVTRDTLFELGSISKTFTATLAARAEVDGKLSLHDPVTKHLPELKGSALDRIRLLELATHTAGGFPLQLPDELKTREDLMSYFRNWKPQFPPGVQRHYANPSIGLLGVAVAKALGGDFTTWMEGRLFPELGLKRTFIKVPTAALPTYAWGYNREDKPVRVNPGLLDSEAYGVKSNTTDMLRVIEAHMGIGNVSEKLSRALKTTRTGYYKTGEMIQDMIWEQYPYPAPIERMLAGNSPAVIFEPNPVTPILPPLAPGGAYIINKTGSTNGFGAYVAFIPTERIGIVLLANKNYPIESRVRAAHQVLTQLTAR